MKNIQLKQLRFLIFLLFIGTSLTVMSCKDDDMMIGEGNTNMPSDTTMVSDTTMMNDTTGVDTGGMEPELNLCDSTALPVVMMHGALASGDTYATHAQRFSSNNYCPDLLFAFDWNTLNQGNSVDILDALIDEILAQTGANQINLVGHSAGGGLGYSYLEDATRAAKVAHYAHLGSNPNAQPAGPNGETPTINIWSEDDLIVQGGDITGATNVHLPGFDHYEIATSDETFEAMYEFFNDSLPTSSSIIPSDELLIGGRAVTLGENVPLEGATINIYALDAATGNRINDMPDATLTTDAGGYWSGFEAAADTYYEFHLISANASDRKIHYYREPFIRSNPMVYLRAFPPASSIAGLLLAGIPQDENQSALSIFTANQAVLYQRDELKVEGFDLATAEYATPEKTIIAYFLYDDGNGQTDGNIHATFSFLGTFLTGVDYFTPATEPTSLEIEFNNRSMNVPNRKSSEGVMVVVFD